METKILIIGFKHYLMGWFLAFIMNVNLKYLFVQGYKNLMSMLQQEVEHSVHKLRQRLPVNYHFKRQVKKLQIRNYSFEYEITIVQKEFIPNKFSVKKSRLSKSF